MTVRRPALRSRAHTYLVLIGVVIGMLVAGLAVPLVFGDPGTKQVASTGLTSTGGGSLQAGDAGAAGATGGGPAADQPTATTAPVGGAAATGTAGGATGASTGAGAVAGGAGGATKAAAGGGATGAAAPKTVAASSGAAAAGEPIKVGVLLLNIGNISAIGFGGGPGLSPADQQTVWQAYIDDINAAGGIDGRPLKPIFQTYDPLSDDNMRAACLALTRDAKATVVVDAGGFVGSSILCVTKENSTPFILTASSGVPAQYYAESAERLFTLFQSAQRAMKNFVAELPNMGVPKTAKIGILADYYGNIKETPDLLQKFLQDAGYTVAYRNDLSGDLQTGSSQMPVEVTQMRSHGVQVIVNISNALYITQFVQEADAQQFHPSYVSSDWQGGSTNFYFENMPDSFDGSPVVTISRVDESKVGRPEPPIDAACNKRAEAALKTNVDRDTDAYGMYVRICSIAKMLQAGFKAAAQPITGDTFKVGMTKLGRLDLAGFGGGALGPGRPDAADRIRTVKWRSSCKCLMPVDDFRPTQF